jgi:ribonuclease HI
MRFREEIVWVKVDESGRPVVDPEGRAEMKYRESDEKSYRPSARNLQPLTEAEASAPIAAPKPRATARSRATTSSASAREGARVEAPVAPEDLVHVWTDGACSGNPGPMGIGVVVLAGGARQELGAYLGIGTNNIAELTAIERGLALAVSWLGEETAEKKAVRVYSDSNYAIGLLSKGWKAKANQELVARIRTALKPFRRLSFVKVEGHAGIAENERCDELARQAVARRR